MVKIRLTRQGAKKSPFYRIVAIDERMPREGRPLEFLGTYDPGSEPERIVVKSDRIDAWVAQGAQLSPRVRTIVRRAKRQAAAGATS